MREVGDVEFCGADRGAVGAAGGGGVCAAEVGSAGLNLAPAPSVMPANAGTHTRKDRSVARVDPRNREDDGAGVAVRGQGGGTRAAGAGVAVTEGAGSRGT